MLVYNGSVQRLQMSYATQPKTLINPLQQNCYTAIHCHSRPPRNLLTRVGFLQREE